MKLFFTGALLAATAASFATVITFDDGAVTAGNTLSNQYAGLGVTFAGGTSGLAVPNPAATTQGFATTTDMTIVSSTGGDVGGGVSSPISGNMLHSFNGWLGEDGDAAYTMTFSGGITAISVDFGGVSDSASAGLYAFNAAGTLVGSVAGISQTGTFTLSLSGLVGANRVVVTEGDYGDWVGTDNINFTSAVPEPASMTALGLGTLALIRRRKSR